MAFGDMIVSNYWKYYLLSLVQGHTYTVYLMQPGFVYNAKTMKKYSDVSASEIATAGGYVNGTGLSFVVTGGAAIEDDTDSEGVLPYNNLAFTPSAQLNIAGGIILDNTINGIVGYADGGGNLIIDIGQPYVIIASMLAQ